MDEIWKDIDGFEGMYQISNLGRVKSLPRLSLQKHEIQEKILNTCHSCGGYVDVSLYKDGKRYHKKPHRLVAEAFIPNPNDLPEVDHIDTNKDNNCVDNLRWCTHSENYENPLTRIRLSEIQKSLPRPENAGEKLRVKVLVYKNGILDREFSSYKELQEMSRDVYGFTIYSQFVRKVLRGEMENYHGYTFEIIDNRSFINK